MFKKECGQSQRCSNVHNLEEGHNFGPSTSFLVRIIALIITAVLATVIYQGIETCNIAKSTESRLLYQQAWVIIS